MVGKYILTHDLGTTSLKSVLFDLKLNPLYKSAEPYPLHYPQPGWAEQDANDWWNAVSKTTKAIIGGNSIDPSEIAAISFDCQGNCTIPIDKEGKPLTPAISWLDTRASEIVAMYAKGFPKIAGYSMKMILKFLKITGGGPGHHGKDPISHINWYRLRKPDIYEKTFKFLSCKGYVLFKCTNNAVMSRDVAHTTWMMDSNPGQFIWSDKILDLNDIDKEKLPEIRKSTEKAGELNKEAANKLGLMVGTPVIIGAVDLTAAAIGAGAILDNQYFISLGTADWIAAHVPKPLKDIRHYVGTMSSSMDNYLCICKQETGGKCLDWIKIQMFKDFENANKANPSKVYKELDSIVEKTEPGSKSLLFLPWMFGERSPINDSEVRGGFLNLSLEHGRAHMLRSVYEGIAYNIRLGLGYLKKWTNWPKTINAVGGGFKSDIWCQIFADILNSQINQMQDPELGAVKGAAVIAMVGLGILNNFSDAISLIKLKKTYSPNPDNLRIYDKLYGEFAKIYQRNKKMFKSLNL